MGLQFTSKPDVNKTFAQNYYDHLSFFYKPENGTNILNPKEDGEVLLNIPIPLKPIVRPFGRLNVNKALQDRYDYVDEIIGATIAPIACVLASIYFLAKAVANLWTFVLINNLSKNQITEKMYFRATLGNFCYALFALGMAIYCLVKSIASLIIRPLLTLISGYNLSGENRFCTGIWDHDERKSSFRRVELNDLNDVEKDKHYFDDWEADWHFTVQPRLGF